MVSGRDTPPTAAFSRLERRTSFNPLLRGQFDQERLIEVDVEADGRVLHPENPMCRAHGSERGILGRLKIGLQR